MREIRSGLSLLPASLPTSWSSVCWRKGAFIDAGIYPTGSHGPSEETVRGALGRARSIPAAGEVPRAPLRTARPVQQEALRPRPSPAQSARWHQDPRDQEQHAPGGVVSCRSLSCAPPPSRPAAPLLAWGPAAIAVRGCPLGPQRKGLQGGEPSSELRKLSAWRQDAGCPAASGRTRPRWVEHVWKQPR